MDNSQLTVKFNKKSGATSSSSVLASVTTINHTNDQLIINGANFTGTTNVTLDGQALTIITNTAGQLILAAASNVAITFGATMNLIITNAAGASAPVAVTFNAVNGSILSAHLAVGAVDTNSIATNAVTNTKF